MPPPTGHVVGNSVRPGNVRDAMTEAHAIAGGALGRPSQMPTQQQKGKKTIMLVDQDASLRARLRDQLITFYDVVEAKDGMEAVEMTSKLPPQTLAMIITDVVMPRVDGFTLAKIIRNNPNMKKLPIMFVSAKNGPQEVTQALVLGACQFLPKTTPIPQIVEKIRKIVV
jgi:CheY-like chemotaxis protein